MASFSITITIPPTKYFDKAMTDPPPVPSCGTPAYQAIIGRPAGQTRAGGCPGPTDDIDARQDSRRHCLMVMYVCVGNLMDLKSKLMITSLRIIQTTKRRYKSKPLKVGKLTKYIVRT